MVLKKNKFFKKTYITIMFILTIFVSTPLFVMISYSLRKRRDMFSSIILPINPTIINYINIITDSVLMRNLLNSIFLATSVGILTVALSTFTAYGFSRYSFKSKNILLIMLFILQMFPPILVATGFFRFISSVGLYDTLTSLIIVNSVRTLPFGIWLMKSYLDEIPKSIDEAAKIDGATTFQAYFKIIVPLCKPGIIATGIWAFVTAWNEYLLALTFISSTSKNVITTSIVGLLGQFVVQWGPVMSYALTVSAPVLIAFVYFQKYFISGLTGGAVKY